MKINVRVFGDISEVIGKKHDLDLEKGTTVAAAAEKVSELSGQKRGYLGDFPIGGKDIALLVNGKNIELGEGLGTVLHDGDELVIFQPTVGG